MTREERVEVILQEIVKRTVYVPPTQMKELYDILMKHFDDVYAKGYYDGEVLFSYKVTGGAVYSS